MVVFWYYAIHADIIIKSLFNDTVLHDLGPRI